MALFRCMTKSGGGGFYQKGSFVRANNSQRYKIALGFKPKYFSCWLVEGGSSGTTGFSNSYSEDYNANKAFWLTRGAQAGAIYDIDGTDTANRIYTIDSDGVTMATVNTNGVGTWYYVAIG